MPEGFISHSFADSSTGFKIEKTEGDITTTILLITTSMSLAKR